MHKTTALGLALALLLAANAPTASVATAEPDGEAARTVDAVRTTEALRTVEAVEPTLAQTPEAEPAVAYRLEEQDALRVAVSFRDNAVFAGDEQVGVKRGDTYYFNLNVVAAAFGFRVEAYGTDGGLKVEDTNGYGFTVSAHPVSTLYWEGRAVRTVGLPYSLHTNEAQQPYIAQPSMEALFGLRLVWGETQETAELVFPLFASEFVGFPETVDGDTLRVDAQVRTSGAHSGPLLRLYRPDAVEQKEGVSSFELVQWEADYPYKTTAALPLLPGTNRIWALLQANQRIVAASERDVTARLGQFPLVARSSALSMMHFSEIEWSEPTVGYAVSHDGGVSLNGEVRQAVSDELTVIVEKLQNGAFVRAAKETVPLTGETFEQFVRWPGGPGLYRFRMLSESIVHHGQTGTAEIARFYAEYPKPTALPDESGTTVPADDETALPDSNGTMSPVDNETALPDTNGSMPPAGNETTLPDTSEATPPSGSDAPPADGETAQPTAIEQERALQIVADLGIVPDGYQVKEAQIEQRPAYFVIQRRQIDPFHQGPAYWVIRYASPDGTGAEWRVQLDAATGRLIGFHREQPLLGPMYSPAVSYEEAKAIADAFVARVNGDIVDQLRYDDSREHVYTDPLSGSMASAYGISYHRLAGGIPYPQNGVHLTIDGDGTIISYNYNWNDSVRFEDLASAMDPQQAEQAFRDRVAPAYLVPLDRPEHARPVYEFFPSDLLEAATGRFLDINLLPVPDVGRNPIGAKWLSDPLSELLSEPPVAPIEPLTQEEATAIAKTIMNLPEDSELGEVRLNGNLWQLNFKPGGSDSTESALVNLHRLTGLPVNYFHFRPPTGQGPIVSWQQARETAERFLTSVMPYAVNELYPLDDDLSAAANAGLSGQTVPYQYDYWYRQIRQGVSLGDIRVSVTPGNGEIVDFAVGITSRAVTAPPASFPELVPPEQAQAAVFERNRLELVYVSPYEPRSYTSDYAEALANAKDTDPSRVDARLVYRWKLDPHYSNAAVDAQTGAWIDRRFGEALQER